MRFKTKAYRHTCLHAQQQRFLFYQERAEPEPKDQRLYFRGTFGAITGDWRFLYNAETTYGLGTDKTTSAAIDVNGHDTASQDLKYYQVRVHQTGSWKLLPNISLQASVSTTTTIIVSKTSVLDGRRYRPSRTGISIRSDMGSTRSAYSVSGVSLNVLYDSRDNQISAYKGTYANVNFRVNPEWLGSSRNSSLLLTEYRTYVSIGRPALPAYPCHMAIREFRHRREYCLTCCCRPSGMINDRRSGRGFTFGRLRGEDMLYGEGNTGSLFPSIQVSSEESALSTAPRRPDRHGAYQAVRLPEGGIWRRASHHAG